MQKNRTAVAAGILALALIVGGFALWNNQKADNPSETVEMEEPSTEASTQPTNLEGDEAAGTETTDPATDATAPETKTDSKGTDGKKPEEKGNTSSTTIPETHTVAKDETLRDIATRYYGDPVYSADIERVNELENPNMITVGKVLKLPRRDELNNTAAPTTTTTTETGADETPTN